MVISDTNNLHGSSRISKAVRITIESNGCFRNTCNYFKGVALQQTFHEVVTVLASTTSSTPTWHARSMPYCFYTYNGVYLLHFVPRLLGILIFSYYDTKCAFYENASIFNCTQEFPVANPKRWILVWLVSSILSSIAFYFICCSLGPQRYVKKTYKTLKFLTMVMLSLIISASFFLRIINTELKDFALFLALFWWWPSTIVQIIYLSNQHPAKYPYSKCQCSVCNEFQKTDSAKINGIPCNQKNQGNTLWFYLVYYASLIFQCLECLVMAFAITIDAGLVLIPVAVVHGEVHGRGITGVIKILVPARVVFIYSLVLLYAQKLFHGKTILFPKPGEPLEPKELEQHGYHDVDGTAV